MGFLFSGKKQVFVTSVAYNLAGDIKKRIQFLPTVIAGNVIVGRNESMAETIKTSLLTGPGLRLRKFGKWARSSGYTDALKIQPTVVYTQREVLPEAVMPYLPLNSGERAIIHAIEVDWADYTYWADEWLLNNHPNRVNNEYEVDYSSSTGKIFITFKSGEAYSFTPNNFIIGARYIYVTYAAAKSLQVKDTVEGETFYVNSPSDFPSTSGWYQEGTVSEAKTEILHTVVETTITYSDARPEETNTVSNSETENYTEYTNRWSKTDYIGSTANPGANESVLREQIRTTSKKKVIDTVTTVNEEILPDGVVKTTTVVTTTDTLVNDFYYRVDSTTTSLEEWSSTRLFKYREGSGNSFLDSQFGHDWNLGNFFPFIPIRLKNKMVSPSHLPHVYQRSKKALKKALGTDYDDLVKSIEENDSIEDIDYAYATFGVSLNTPEKQGIKYIWHFFKHLFDNDAMSSWTDDYALWRARWEEADQINRGWSDWRAAQSNPNNPLFGTPEPRKVPYPARGGYIIGTKSSDYNYNMQLNMTSIVEINGSGRGRPGAKKGDCWISRTQPENFDIVFYENSVGVVTGVVYNSWFVRDSSFVVYNQIDDNSYTAIGVGQLSTRNWIYNDKSHIISAREAFEDTEESSLIIPLHEEVLRKMSLAHSTQLSFACCYLQFNCIEVVKQRWYETEFFGDFLKFVLVAITIVVTIVVPPAGVGILGAAGAVGTALGFTGTLAIIVGTLANYLAAFLLSKILTAAAVSLFGEQVGAIVGAIASMVAINVGTNLMNGGTFSTGFGNMLSSDNLLKLTSASLNVYTDYLKETTKGLVEKTQEMLREYTTTTEKVNELWEQNLGYGKIGFDPLMLTESGNAYLAEPSQSFLTRTLLTGSEIANLSQDMLYNFPKLTLNTDMPV